MSDYPINRCWNSIPDVDDLEIALVLDGYWHPDRQGFYLILYDMVKNRLVKFLDTSVLPHIKVMGEVSQNTSDLPITKTEMYHALSESSLVVSQVPTQSGNIYYNNMIERSRILNRATNFDLVYFHEKQITPGTHISIEDGDISLFVSNSSDIRKRLLGEHEDIIELAETNMPFIEQAIPELKRIAFDIEVSSPRGVFPVPEKADFKIHAIASFDIDGQAIMWMLGFNPTRGELEGIETELGYLPEIRSFLREQKLLKDFFATIASYPIILSYNGDNFDLHYLQTRAKRLGIEAPISEGFQQGYYYRKQYHFKGSLHIDLFRFFSNNSVRLYAFGAKYDRFGLDDVAEGLLGERKVDHDTWFDEMSRPEMVIYNIRDAELTLRLTTFSHSLTMAVMIMIMRVGKMTLTQVNRASISNWILNWIAFEHARKGWILPNKDELREKGVFDSDARISGKQYQGAIVFEPEPGIYWDVTVADYASLYPSVIKKFRLSYETLRCNHDKCRSRKASQVPELSHWVCDRQGIMSSLVGYVRDIRVKHYKSLATNGESEEIRTLANTIQAALKVFINASYGVFGNSKFALFCPPVAESTTAYSRHALLEAKKLAEERGFEVVYGDTDSIFVHKLTEQEFAILQAWSIVELGIELGIDYNFRYLVLSGRKKNYFGIKKDGGTITKGLQVKKSNTAQFIKDLYQEILERLTQVQDADQLQDALSYLKDKIRKTRRRLQAGDYQPKELARMASLTKAFDSYETKTPALQVAIQEITQENQEEFYQGTQFMIVPTEPRHFVVSTTKFPKFPPGYTMECKYQEVSRVNPVHIAWDRLEIELQKAFSPIFESLGLNWNADIHRDTSLDQYLFNIG